MFRLTGWYQLKGQSAGHDEEAGVHRQFRTAFDRHENIQQCPNRHDDRDRQDCGSLTEARSYKQYRFRIPAPQKLTQKMRMLAQACTQADWATSASAHVTVLQYKSRLRHSRLCSRHTIVRKQKQC